ncbi:MAG TPA: type VI secretion system-associated FHA domain protein TagH [Scandinavium sp.]|jgi:type VI secretion system protein ImpI|uniref:type VI secretion system-associated FHA domain protein TagH n=1 Tax=Scandinavium sp. TaxID=2830653 RepID=UPI002E348000|nr:type VI secretion system-associated FHA domain protein TagH [Scandinavium sp.]HEX4504028.1 type VI secretion system-associated FHA domain protein TagH [Scandinavium sp.]
MEQALADEKQHQTELSLTLQVMNGNELASGRAAKCLFNHDGGDIGHAEGCHWLVQDRADAIAGRACSILLHDGAFCLKSLMPGMMINLAPVSIDAGLVRLRQGDEISLGALVLKVFLHEGKRISYEEQMAAPESIVNSHDSLADTLLSTDNQPAYPGMPHRHQLGATVANAFSVDPLQVLQTESLVPRDEQDRFSSRSHRAPQSDLKPNGGIDTAFMDLPPVYANPRDDDEFEAEDITQRHLALTPLLRGLGSSLSVRNSQDADAFLEEAGRALQAAVQGLLDLQHSQNSLSDKHLRPLEDNPLRLNLNYSTVLDVMFAEGKSPVHLAAPAAIRESLRNIRHHEEANGAAIAEALQVMLDAFSPQNLMRRFVQYRRSHELRHALDDAGAWQMYSHYYDELASDRQQGFAMLFNEVYAQVYDRTLREKQREQDA